MASSSDQFALAVHQLCHSAVESSPLCTRCNWSFTADAVNIERVSFEDPALELSLARRNAALLLNRNG